ncbi:hypothetical protein ACEPAI_6089 [Sanghuangporus weigelae]
MGNTPSSPTSSLRRDPSFISGPRTLGSVLSRARSKPLGPEYIISPFTIDSSSSQNINEHPNASQDTINKHRLASSNTTATTTTNRSPGHRRSFTYAASQTSLRSSESAVDIRRSRSANVPGPSKAERSSEFLAQPPPYSPTDPSSSTLHLPHTYGGFLDVPGGPRREKGHRRAASDETQGHRRYPTNQTDESEYEESVPEEYGYGVGSGMRNELSYNRMRRLPPLPAESASVTGEIMTSPTSTHSREDPLELLKQYDTIFIIDDSVSMVGERWTETREALASLAEVAARYDTEGIDVYFLNARRSARNMRSGESVKRQFDSIEPQGISLLARRLEELLNDYISELEQAQREILRGDLNALHRVKPVNYIIITDGVPTDDPEPVIIQAARRLDRGNLPVYQVGIQFVQVGDDPRATEALRELDDDLAKEYGIRDMVDTTPYNGGSLDSELLIKILLGGINRRVDKKGARSIL